MKQRFLTYFSIATALLMVSCSSDNVIEEIRDITESTDPMRFSGINNQNQVTRTDPTIPNLLQQNFMVSTYKNFGTANQQTVMPMYEVNYEQYTASNGEQTSWNYISADTDHQFYQTQYEKYWDYSAFPYRFHAVSPAPVENGQLIENFVLSDTRLYIPSPYIYQTCQDGVISAGAEPCMVAQVQRNGNGKDYDLLAKEDDGVTYPKEINKGSQTKNRSVALPFHHLTSKVRFAIYCPEYIEGDEHHVYDVKIKVRSSDFVTSAIYSADLSSGNKMTDGSFGSAVTSNSVTLLETTHGSHLTNNDLCYCNSPQNAYWFECPEGLLQVPQDRVQLSISFKVEGRLEDETVGDFMGDEMEFNDVPIVVTTPQRQDIFNWEMGYIYTYYIQVGPFTTITPTNPIIIFTCTVEPWEEISGSLNTGIED